jgi:hypothetical protein
VDDDLDRRVASARRRVVRERLAVDRVREEVDTVVLTALVLLDEARRWKTRTRPE